MSIHLLESTLPSMSESFSRLDVVGQCTRLSNDGYLSHHHSTTGHAHCQDLTRSTLQSFLKFLDRHYHIEGVNSAYKEITRICITGMLESCQSEAATVEEYAGDNSTTSRAIFAFQHLLSDQAYGPLSRESVNTLQEVANLPFRQLTPDLSSVSRELGTQPFKTPAPEIGAYSEGGTFSASRYQQLRPPIVQGDQKKVRCTWQGCSSVVNRESHARHVDEIHQKKVRDVCTGCEKVFQRMYMKKQHVCHGPRFKRTSA